MKDKSTAASIHPHVELESLEFVMTINPAPIVYDEFGMFHENAAEYSIAFSGPPTVHRQMFPVHSSAILSGLVWGSSAPEFAFLHGGAQNAHTWDTVGLAMNRPMIALDLPGHGHSDTAIGDTGIGDTDPFMVGVQRLVDALSQSTTQPVHLVGMSLGGLMAIATAALAPHLVRSLTLVDITPGVNQAKTQAITAFVNGPATFDSFDDLLARTIQHNPTRSQSSLRRGILHNALQLPDGSWIWRYRRGDAPSPMSAEAAPARFAQLWEPLAALHVPVMLARGMLAQSVLDDHDESTFLQHLPEAQVRHFAHAGHSVQGDMPVELAAAISEFADSTDSKRR